MSVLLYTSYIEYSNTLGVEDYVYRWSCSHILVYGFEAELQTIRYQEA